MKGLLAGLVALMALGLLFFFYTAEKATTVEMTEAEVAQIESEVLTDMSMYVESLAAKDLDSWAGIFHPTETSFAWSGTIHDHDGLVERFEAFWDPWETWDGKWVGTKVKVLSYDAAMFQGEYEATVLYDDGRVLHWPGNANFTSLVERTPDGWKVTIGNWDNGSYQVIEEG